jgi:hypothetical protein
VESIVDTHHVPIRDRIEIGRTDGQRTDGGWDGEVVPATAGMVCFVMKYVFTAGQKEADKWMS